MFMTVSFSQEDPSDENLLYAAFYLNIVFFLLKA